MYGKKNGISCKINSDIFFCKVRMFIVIWGWYLWNYIAFKMSFSPHRMKMFDLTSETDFACMICCPQIKYRLVKSLKGERMQDPFGLRQNIAITVEILHFCTPSCFSYLWCPIIIKGYRKRLYLRLNTYSR